MNRYDVFVAYSFKYDPLLQLFPQIFCCAYLCEMPQRQYSEHSNGLQTLTNPLTLFQSTAPPSPPPPPTQNTGTASYID